MTKRKHAHGWPPKGSYPHPDGGYIQHGRKTPGNPVRITVHLKAEPDTEKLALAVIEIAKQLEENRDN